MNTITRRSNARAVRWVLLATVLGVMVFAGWRITHGMLADAALADGDINTALGWDGDHPEALLRQAEAQLANAQLDAAAATARHLLQVEPTDGRGYRILAQVAVAQKLPAQALPLFQIAARRAPRDLPARAWLAQHALEQGDVHGAIEQIDSVLTLSPSSGTRIYPVLLTLAKAPEFAEALADALQRNPPWRASMLAALRNAGPDEQGATSQVMGALQTKGGMDPAETSALIDALLRSGRWGEAHARWAAPIVANGQPLPILYNGDFAQDPAGSGFDWRMPVTPGVIQDFEQGQGAGRMLHLRFLGRRVVSAFLEHPLFLAPGSYIFRFRQRSEALRSENGISWTLACAASSGQPLAESLPLNGSRQWSQVELRFMVPADGCQGQWLRLGNAKGVAIGQILGGDAWIDAPSLQVAGRQP
ncbi:MAG: hypothetical protein ABIP87_07725 [Thermomonas sp.]